MPTIYVIGGPNGAGKTTTAMAALPTILRCWEFVNADEIARGLSPFSPSSVALQAGRLMLERMDWLRAKGCDFAIETTLASRSLAGFLKQCQAEGFVIELLYIWLQSRDLAIHRVVERVLAGGHYIPNDVIERRYFRSVHNFIEIYAPLARSWVCYDNSDETPVLLAKSEGIKKGKIVVANTLGWSQLLTSARKEDLER